MPFLTRPLILVIWCQTVKCNVVLSVSLPAIQSSLIEINKVYPMLHVSICYDCFAYQLQLVCWEQRHTKRPRSLKSDSLYLIDKRLSNSLFLLRILREIKIKEAI